MKSFSILIIIFLGISFAYPQSKGLVKGTYHNMTSHYNGYFIAKDILTKTEKGLVSKYKWDYNRQLPIFIPFDTTTSRSLKSELDESIEKASLSIQRHPGSRWEYDSYNLVAKARYLGSEFKDAIETYKFVNTNAKNKHDRHVALIGLLRCFTHNLEYNNAQAVSDYLKKIEMRKSNLRKLYLTRAYYHQRFDDFDNMAFNLEKALELLPRSNEKGRLAFILGQYYQQIGDDTQAYSNYSKALKWSKNYELSFYTKLNLSQVTLITKSSDKKKIDLYFKKLLKDPKNIDYKDRILYDMAEFEMKQGNTEKAIKLYKESASAESKNKAQKANSYIKLADIHYSLLKDYQTSKLYYDSVLINLPKDDLRYLKIEKKQKILLEFVKHKQTIEKNDSLLALSSLSASELDSVLLNAVNQKEQQQEKKKNEDSKNTTSNFIDPENTTISTTLTGTWYFYNQGAISTGASEFKRKWGNRTLEDDWRRSTKASIDTNDKSEVELSEEKNQNATATKTEDLFDREKELRNLKSSIPQSEEAKMKLLKETDDAYFELGKIYYLQLDESSNAITTYDLHLVKFPASEHKAEVLYQLFLLNENRDSLRQLELLDILKSEFPNSDYTKLAINPNYLLEQDQLTKDQEEIYEKAYRLYEREKYDSCLYQITKAVQTKERTSYTDRLALLYAIALGKEEGNSFLQIGLSYFLKNYSESPLKSFAENTLEGAKLKQQELFVSSKPIYQKNTSDESYVILIPVQDSSMNTIKQLESFILESQIDYFANPYGWVEVDSSFKLFVVTSFPSQNEGREFISKTITFLQEQIKDEVSVLTMYMLSEKNFKLLYSYKDPSDFTTYAYSVKMNSPTAK